MNRAIHLIVLNSAVLFAIISAFRYEDCVPDEGKVIDVKISGCDHLTKYCILPENEKQTIEINFTTDKVVNETSAAGDIVMKSRSSDATFLPVKMTHLDPCGDPKSGQECPLDNSRSYHYRGTFKTSPDAVGPPILDAYFRIHDKVTSDIISCIKFNASHYLLDEKLF